MNVLISRAPGRGVSGMAYSRTKSRVRIRIERDYVTCAARQERVGMRVLDLG